VPHSPSKEETHSQDSAYHLEGYHHHCTKITLGSTYECMTRRTHPSGSPQTRPLWQLGVLVFHDGSHTLADT
jgi:hypothetical protein